MLINFLNPNLSPTVECDAVSDDTHHFNNLISKDFQEKALGFMAYSGENILYFCRKFWKVVDHIPCFLFSFKATNNTKVQIEFQV